MLSVTERVKRCNHKRRLTLIDIMGGKCLLCGFNQFPEALEFHHINPQEKEFQLSGSALSRSLVSQIAEIQKCTILCANCHRGVHCGYLELPDNPCTFDSNKAEKYLQEKEPQIFTCDDCGKEITPGAKYCAECVKQHKQIISRPTRETLKKQIRTQSFLSIGKSYGVSDNAIRKWCTAMNLPNKKTDINKYSDKEWLLI